MHKLNEVKKLKYYANPAKILQWASQIHFCSQSSYGESQHCRLDVAETPVVTSELSSSSSSLSQSLKAKKFTFS